MKKEVLEEGKEYKGKIGLEIHCYIVSNEKLFCSCRASREKGLKENSLICPICTGQPGAKPMLPNESAVRKAVQIGLMLGCKINSSFKWQRKHYNWPDLPKGYQNTLSGSYAIPVGEKGKFNGMGIWSMHLEEDPASWNPETGCIDYNRSGLPLVEIVTAPDFSTADEVMEWLKKLLHNLDYLKAIDSNAGIKVDTNVNIPNKTERVEIKNINSIEDIGRAINYELQRQSTEGSKMETRRFDSEKGITVRMRGKEEAEDYRFISDPDLEEIVIDKNMVKGLKESMPESPEEKLKKLTKRYKIGKEDASVLAKNIDVVEFFEKVVEKVSAGFALHWVTVNLLRLLNDNKVKLNEIDIKPEHFISLLKLIESKKITELQGKEILKKFYPKSFSPDDVKGRITNLDEIKVAVINVINTNKSAAESYKNGDEKALNFLMGEVMKATNKRADYKIAREVLIKMLK